MENVVIFVLLIFIRKNVVVKQVAETKIVAPAPTNAQGVQGGPLGGGGGQERPWGPAGGSLIRNAVAGPFWRILKKCKEPGEARFLAFFQNSPKRTCNVTMQTVGRD